MLYEMLTGDAAIQGGFAGWVIAAVLERDAPSQRSSAADAGQPRSARAEVPGQESRRSLADRARFEERIGLGARRARGCPARSNPRKRRSAMAFVRAAARRRYSDGRRAGARRRALACSPGSAPQRTVTRHSLNLPPGITLHIPINGTSIDIAPDGSRIAFIGVQDGTTSLFIHTLATGVTMPVPDTREAVIPMFSADSQWVAFGVVGAIKKVPAGGGPVQVMTAGGGGPMTWLGDGRVVRGSASGGGINEHFPKQRSLTTVAEDEEGHLTPLALPDGSLLFTALRGGMLSTLNSINVWRPGATERRK